MQNSYEIIPNNYNSYYSKNAYTEYETKHNIPNMKHNNHFNYSRNNYDLYFNNCPYSKTTPNFYNKNRYTRHNEKINIIKKEGEEYLDELNKTMNDINKNRNNINLEKILNITNNNNQAYENGFNNDENKELEYEIEEMKSKCLALSNDNIMLKEDIYRFNNINRNIENEIINQRKYNLSLVEQNTNINNQNIALKEKINESRKKIDIMEANCKVYKKSDIVKGKIYYKNLELKKEYDYNKLCNKKNKLEEDFYLLKEKYSSLEEKNNFLSKELNELKAIQDNKLSDLENKISEISEIVGVLKEENTSLKSENKTLRNSIVEINNDRENYEIMFNEQKMINDNLSGKIKGINKELEKIKMENMIENNNIRKKEKEKNNFKKDLIFDFQRRINEYKNMQLRYEYSN